MNALRRLLHSITGRHGSRVSPGFTAHGEPCPAHEICDVCEIYRPIVLPARHPESMTVELEPHEEELLAALDDLTWPEATNREFSDRALRELLPHEEDL